jgi:predicted PhzF superfamily epimerase YddE/YHI9
VAAQGAALGRAGRVHVAAEDGEVWIGGDVVACIEGHLDLGAAAATNPEPAR